VVYGEPRGVLDLMGFSTAYVEKNESDLAADDGRMVRKTLSFSKEKEMLEASCAWEDGSII